MTPFTVAAAQSRSEKGDIACNVRRHVEFAHIATRHQSNLIVFPELSLTGYEPTIAAETAIEAHDSVLHPLKEASDDCGIAIIAGCPIASAESKPYLGAFILMPGMPVSVYRKRFVTTEENKYFIASSDSFVCDLSSQRIAVAICADVSHPAHALLASQNNATIYAAGVMMTPDDIARAAKNMSAYAKQHRMLTVMANHASETGGYATAGRSAMWDEVGGLVAQAGRNGECLVVARKTVDKWSGHIASVGIDSEEEP